MDDLLREFATETGESLDTADYQLVRSEHEPSNAKTLDNIFRLPKPRLPSRLSCDRNAPSGSRLK